MFLPVAILLAAVRLSDACFEMDTGYLGDPRGSNGVGRKQDIASAFECQKACQAKSNCEYWTWNGPDWRSKNGVCYFKSSTEGRLQGPNQAGRISGPAYCDCFAYDTSIGRGKQVNGAGNGAGAKEDVPTPFACQQECQMNDDCNVWIWNDADHAKNPNKCWMKKAATEPTVGQANDIHRISGPKFCDCFAHNATIGRGRNNGAGKVEDVGSALECQMHCQMTEECNAFIWNGPEHKRNPNVCWMKTAVEGDGIRNTYNQKKDQHRVSGPKFCGPLEDA